MAVSMAQVAQEKGALIVQETLYKKKCAAQKRMAEDNRAIQTGLQQLWQDRSNYLQKVRERRALFLEEKKQRAKDRLLIQDLSNERSVWTKGLYKIDRLKEKKALLNEKCLIVQQRRETEKYQKDLLKRTKELRAQEAYTRRCEEKFVFNMIAFQKSWERLQEAKAKVAVVNTNASSR
nr:leucine rich repeats and IQ motif containing 3 [Molossus molossus]